MGGSTNRTIATAIRDLVVARTQDRWAEHACEAYSKAKLLQDSFFPEELHTVSLKSPRRNIIFSAGDPTSIVQGLHPIIETEVVPELS
jgi:hypothetical protein